MDCKEQLVWAKLHGYPWWPGVAVRNFRDFYEAYKNNSKKDVISKQTFIKDLRAANRILMSDSPHGAIQEHEEILNTENFNENFETKTNQISENNIQVDSNSSQELFEAFLLESLKKKIFFEETKILKTSSKSHLIKIQKELSKHIIYADFTKILEILIDIFNYDLTADLLSSTKLINILKYFSKAYSKHEIKSIRSLAKLVKIVYYRWKNIIICDKLCIPDKKTEKIINPELREKVCRKVVDILSKNGFDLSECETLAISIENNIRKRDPTMKDQYIKFIKKMLKDIALLDKMSYLKQEMSL